MTKSSNPHHHHRSGGGGPSKDEHADQQEQQQAEPEIDPAMKAEIEAAVGFLTDFLVKAPKQGFSSESVDLFRRNLQNVLCRHYHGHWHSASPLRGSGFRCLRINGKVDPLVARAAEASRLPLRKVRQAFPAELTVWIDPGDVSVRFGEEGSIGVWYAARRTGDEEERAKKQLIYEENHQQQQRSYHARQSYQQRQSPVLSTTPPSSMLTNVGGGSYSPHRGGAYQHHASPVHYPHRQQQSSSPVWNQPQWQQPQQQPGFSPQHHQHQQHRSSPLPFVGGNGSNGFAMALNHQQIQLRQHQQQQSTTTIRSPSSLVIGSRVSPLPPTSPPKEQTSSSTTASPTPQQEAGNGEEQRCKMLAERLMRENLNLMASLAPGSLVASSQRPQPVGVGVN